MKKKNQASGTKTEIYFLSQSPQGTQRRLEKE
jgi:hypothetical protein